MGRLYNKRDARTQVSASIQRGEIIPVDRKKSNVRVGVVFYMRQQAYRCLPNDKLFDRKSQFKN